MRRRLCAFVVLLGLSPSLAFANESSTGHYEIDPVSDGAILGTTLGFAAILQLIIETSELRPQVPGDPSVLVGIDRWRAESDKMFDHELSNIGLVAFGAFVVADIALAEFLDRDDTWYEHLILYGETVAITLAITDLAKIAVRRPRPLSYRDVRAGVTPTETDLSLSFFSGHASITAAIVGTAAYMAWVRGDALEKWLITIGGGVLSAFTAAMRVAEGKHFPTDVIAGVLVGASVGVLVPHLHRTSGLTIGAAPTDGGATVGLSLSF